MLHSCGQSHFQIKKNRFGIDFHDNDGKSYSPQSITTTQKLLYTAYLGPITSAVSETKDFISLEAYHVVNGKQILVKVVDAMQNNITNDSHYTLNYLKTLPAKTINIADNKYFYILTQLCNKKFGITIQ